MGRNKKFRKPDPTEIGRSTSTIFLVLGNDVVGILENTLVLLYQKIREISEFQNNYAFYPLLGIVLEPFEAEKEKAYLLERLNHVADWIKRHEKNYINENPTIIEMDVSYIDVTDKDIKTMLKHLGAVRR